MRESLDWIISTLGQKIRSLVPAVLRPDLLQLWMYCTNRMGLRTGRHWINRRAESIYQLNHGTSMVQSFGLSLQMYKEFGGLNANMVMVVVRRLKLICRNGSYGF